MSTVLHILHGMGVRANREAVMIDAVIAGRVLAG